MSQPDKIKNRIDFKVLTTTLSIQTKSLHDDAMLTHIREKLNLMDVTVQEDTYGNIYVTKGIAKTYPCVVAHTDTVQDMLQHINIFRTNDTIFAFNPEERRQWGIGGDDKVGVYITLQLLEDIPVMKAVFFRDEEIGSRGSHYSMDNHKEWYNDCGFVLMADRRGNTDVITVSGGIVIASNEFLEACDPIFDRYGYKDAVGICTDVDVLTTKGIGVSTVNLSCGYHEPHSSKEIVSIRDVNRCYNLMYDILLEHYDRVFTYEAKIPEYKSSYKKNGQSYLSSTFNELSKVGLSSPVGERQLKLHLPLIFGGKTSKFSNFTELATIKEGMKVFSYIGCKAIPVTGDTTCSKCKLPALENIFFLPYEGRMYCTKCNDYIDDAKTPALMRFVESEDNDTVFVYSLYSAGWLLKEEAKWSEKISSWVSEQMPF